MLPEGWLQEVKALWHPPHGTRTLSLQEAAEIVKEYYREVADAE